LGQDRYDEVWDRAYVMNPAPSYEHQRLAQQLAVLLDPLARAAGLEAVAGGVNLGDEDSYRIPDASLHRRGSGGAFVSSAALVVEIRSPGDDTDRKIPFHAERGVGERSSRVDHGRARPGLGRRSSKGRGCAAAGRAAHPRRIRAPRRIASAF
jgi:Putative restriction endonuclease